VSRGSLVPRRELTSAASRYELLLKIASGGMGTVYLARSRDLARLVAVKRAHPHVSGDQDGRRMLLEEARLASRIRHANVASVHDVEETEDDVLLVMDYVEGAALSELLEASWARREALPPSVAVRVALDVCAGLAAVHELVGDDGRPLGMVHRDVSPQNVLVGLDGTSRLSDFGLARLAPAREGSRTSGVVLGKLAYVAPEVIDGRRCTATSEVFALGVVVWEALASRRLFKAATEAETLRRVFEQRAPRLSRVAPHLSTALDAPVARALEKDPAARYPSVRAFAEDLEAAALAEGLFATSSEVGAMVAELVGERLGERRERLWAAMRSAALGETSEPSRGRTASLGPPRSAWPQGDRTQPAAIPAMTDVVPPSLRAAWPGATTALEAPTTALEAPTTVLEAPTTVLEAPTVALPPSRRSPGAAGSTGSLAVRVTANDAASPRSSARVWIALCASGAAVALALALAALGAGWLARGEEPVPAGASVSASTFVEIARPPERAPLTSDLLPPAEPRGTTIDLDDLETVTRAPARPSDASPARADPPPNPYRRTRGRAE
jgi:serine/threonine-protein kinase